MTMAKMAGDRRGWGALAAFAGVVACVAGSVGDPASEEALAEVLADAGPEVVIPTYTRFLAEAEQLESAVNAWKAAAELGEADDERAAAQLAWRDAMAVWQEAEILQVGPAGNSATVIGGGDLRDQIYSWPTINPCRIDQEVVYLDWEEETDYFDTALVNVLGLDALEYLLFVDTADNACPNQVDINSEGAWDALGEEGVRRQRAAYAAAVAANLRLDADLLLARWSEDTSAQLATAGEEGSAYESQEQALNALFDAMFYIEIMSKDRKLAQPLGLRDCGAESCPESVESLWSGTGASHLCANLVGLERLFVGGEGQGFDDLLVALEEEALSEDMIARIDAAQLACESVADPLEETLVSDRASVEALHAALGQITDLLKGDLAATLVLQTPSDVEGDND